MLDEVDSDDQLIRRYLLGGLTPEQREQVELRIFADRQYKERVELIEADLIDGYIDGELAEDEHHAFAGHFFSNSHLRLDVRIVKELKQLAGEEDAVAAKVVVPEPPKVVSRPSLSESWFAVLRRYRGPLFTTCLVLLLFSTALLFWFNIESRRLENQLRYEHSPRVDLERAVARLNTPRNEEEKRAAHEAQASASTSVELTPGILRDVPDEAIYPSLNVPVDAAYARLRLKLEDAAARNQDFQALFKTVDSGEQFKVDLLPSGNSGERVIEVILPLSILPEGDYQIQLHGRDASGRLEELPSHYYHLRIVRRTR